MSYVHSHATQERLAAIERARGAVLAEGRPVTTASPAARDGRSYIEDAWQRCLRSGLAPSQPVSFDMVTAAVSSRAADGNRALLEAGRPVLDRLGRALADTGYFAILTNAHGVVIDANGPIDRRDRRAELITRIGVDLSEQRIGSSAISAALHQQRPVWLHRGEHFLAGMSHYSCAGAPIVGPDGQCAGVLDLTGIDRPEWPELIHLVSQAARSIENMLVLQQPHAVQVRLNWLGCTLGDDADGVVCLDADGWVTGANAAARLMVQPLQQTAGRMHGGDLFGIPCDTLFGATRRDNGLIDVPLKSGLRLHALVLPYGKGVPTSALRPESQPSVDQMPLRDAEIALIRKAIDDARGNVMMAARMLGISRATVYRKLDLARQRPLS